MLPQNTRESAIRREEFHQLLQAWLDESLENTVGDPAGHAGLAWLWVRHGGDHYYLNADSSRAGVRDYVRLLKETGGDPLWSTKKATSGIRARVLVGRDQRAIDGFEFYRHLTKR